MYQPQFPFQQQSQFTIKEQTFTIPQVRSCPHTRRSQGVIIMPPEIIAALAGAVHHRLEWAILFQGKRRDNGLTVEIEDFHFPIEQERSQTLVKLPLDLGLGKGLSPKNTVGILHSHHSLGVGAKFSGMDLEDFNRKYPISIVIATVKAGTQNSSGQEARILGFDYYAEGQFSLPCGAIGVCRYYILPKGVKDWPGEGRFGMLQQAVDVVASYKDINYGDCDKVKITKRPKQITATISTACGLSKQEIPSEVFAQNGQIWDSLKRLDEVAAKAEEAARARQKEVRDREAAERAQKAVMIPGQSLVPYTANTSSPAISKEETSWGTFWDEYIQDRDERAARQLEADRERRLNETLGFVPSNVNNPQQDSYGWIENIYRKLEPYEKPSPEDTPVPGEYPAIITIDEDGEMEAEILLDSADDAYAVLMREAHKGGL